MRLIPSEIEPLRLFQNLGVYDGEERRIISDVVFDDEDRLDADDLCVVFDVDPIFQGLDDGDDDPEVALPDEDFVEDRRVKIRDDVLQFPVVVCKEDDRDVQARLLRPPRKLDRRACRRCAAS